MAPSADLWRGLADFLLAYLLVLATPGPNMLLVGAAAALRGARGALPLCLGVSLGAGALCAALLLWVAVSVARRPPIDSRRLARGGRAAGFAAGFCAAATNPVSAAFFAAQFLGPLGAAVVDGGTTAALVPLAAAAAVLAFMLGVAMLLARPACRRAALEWQRPVRLAAAVALAFMALSSAAAALL